MKKLASISLALAATLNAFAAEEANNKLQLEEVFSLEYAADIEISENGKNVYFVRYFMDIQSDKQLGNIWSVDTESKQMLPVTTGNQLDFAPTLSPDGNRLAYISSARGSPQIHLKWLQRNVTAKLTNLTESPSGLIWSPDGKSIAFKMFVKGTPKFAVSLPGKPEHAKWAEPAVLIDSVQYRVDGAGFNTPGYTHIFIVSAEGGSPRQITNGDFDHDGKIAWSKDGSTLYFSANRSENHELEILNSEIYKVDLSSGNISQITGRNGPDTQPSVSPNGEFIAFTGFDDKLTNYENSELYVMNTDGTGIRTLTGDLDRSVEQIRWAANSKGVYFQYNDRGKTKVAYQPLNGKRKILSDALGGQNLGRPYTGADFDVAADGTLAFTYSNPLRPADVAIVKRGKTQVLTHLNQDALGHKQLGKVEAITYKSSADQREIDGWVVYPPDFDSSKKYPLLLEIHGGPVAAYGPHFSAEIQLYAAAGYVVLYTNPRGSESYGKAFAQLIHLNYPSQDFDDLMAGVDTMIAKGFIDEKQLFVTGGSGGGVLTSWIVGHTDRFAAAVVAKPVINWYSFVLTADYYPYFYKYWFGKKPWEDMAGYMRRSPISYVGEVSTPTMLLTGEADYRTPMSETEQYYQALKLQGVESALVRIPGASHSIYKRPSNLMSKVAHILWWFDKYRGKGSTEKGEKEQELKHQQATAFDQIFK